MIFTFLFAYDCRTPGTDTPPTPAGNPMTGETPTGNPSGCCGNIVNALAMISMRHRQSYSSALAASWSVNVRCYGMMRKSGGWNWSGYSALILADREAEGWSWFDQGFSCYNPLDADSIRRFQRDL